LYTEEDCCEKCGKVYQSKWVIYDVKRDKDIEFKSSYYPFCSARCKRQWTTGEGYYTNGKFLDRIWNGKGESYVEGKGYTVLYDKHGYKYKREKDGNWYKVA
jgi:endogenous inhibitor of DNA gyrase (YacG/DUF329 family)